VTLDSLNYLVIAMNFTPHITLKNILSLLVLACCTGVLACSKESESVKHESSMNSKPTGKATTSSTPETTTINTTATPNQEATDVTLVVNLPAFELVLRKGGASIKKYSVGIGRKQFRTILGVHNASSIIWNPAWVPPDSPWVKEMDDVEPGERIGAGDPRNPLGKIKIPLGGSYLIHESAKSSDIGRLVSHGCIRMRRSDLYNLAEAILAARNWPVSKTRVEKAKRSKAALIARLKPPVRIEILYDTIIVRDGTLWIYPDVYHRNFNTVARIRTALQDSGVDTSSIADEILRSLIKRSKKAGGVGMQIDELNGKSKV
jgi:murein L,D-transpeptidase YcbB/YkuD